MTLAGFSLILVAVWTLYAYAAIPLPINDSLFSWIRRQWLFEVMYLLACAGFLSVLWSGRKRAGIMENAPWWKAWLIWMGWAAVSITYSIDRGASLRGFIAFAAYGLLAFTAGELIHSRHDLKVWVRFMVSIAVVACIEGLFQYFSSFKDTLQLMDKLQAAGQLDVHGWSVDVFHDFLVRKRIFSFFGWPNLFAGFLLLTQPMALGLAFSQKRGSRVLWLAVAALLAVCLVLTLSMGAWIAAVISAALIAWLARSGRRVNPARFLVIAALLMVMICLGSFMAAKRARTYITSSTHSRLVYVLGAVNILRRYPVQGTGIGTFGLSYRTLMPREESEGQHSAIHAHNTLLQVASETGIVGLGLFIVLLVHLLNLIAASVRGPARTPLLFGVAAGVLAFFVHSIFEQTFYEAATAPFWWISVGLMTGGCAVARAGRRLPAKRPHFNLKLITAFISVLLCFIVLRLGMSDICAATGGLKGYLNEPAGALRYFESAQRWDPLGSKYSFEAGRYLMMRAEKVGTRQERLDLLRQAAVQFKHTVQCSPWLSGGWLQLAFVQEQLGDIGASMASLAEASSKDPNSRSAVRILAAMQANHGSAEGLVSAAKHWEFLEPKDPEALFYEAQGWQKLGNAENAAKSYREVVALNPKHYAAWFNLAGLLHQAGKDPEAVRAYESYLQSAPEGDTAARSLAASFIHSRAPKTK